MIFEVEDLLKAAVRDFWDIKSRQSDRSTDLSNRGAVVGARQMDGFLSLLKAACIEVGVPETCIYDRHNYIPGFFRSSKDWDFIVISPAGKLLVLIELKSQVGSYGNNFNNRAEEAIGSATDFWTAYRDAQFPTYGTPWMGYLMLIGRERKSCVPVKNYENHYQVLPEFKDASYIDRYGILCRKLMLERLYTATSLTWTAGREEYGDVSTELSIGRFVNSLQGYLIGCKDEFNR